MSEEEVPLLDHEYDGIRELDNSLPAWWLATFIGTVIFGFIYYLHYMSGAGPTSDQELATAMAVVKSARGTGPQYTEESLAALFVPDAVGAGRKSFGEKCAACHGASGEGLIGPNLTDRAWLHGRGTRLDIHRIVREGVTAKGMPAWGDVLPAEEVVALAAFVHSVEGTNVVGGKPPQGTMAPMGN